jgi:hypothetical protein
MSKLARALILAATVAAMNLAGMTAIAHAQTNDQDPPASRNWRSGGATTSRRPGSRRPN